MAQFELSLLGNPRIHAHHQLAKFATRKAQALLILLAVEAVPVSRDKIIDLLWADSDASRGRVSLRTTLNQLRTGLQARVKDPTAAQAIAPLILAEADTLVINPQANLQVDVHVLDEAYTLARKLKAGAASSPETRRILEQAVAVYAGDFLDGFSPGDAPNFDDWVSLQREKWHVRLGVVLDRLSQLQFEGGAFAAGVEMASRWVTHDTFNEIAYRRLMQLHLALGNRAGALQAYETCRKVLAHELNASPSPETEALASRVRTQTLSDERAADLREEARPQVPATALIGRTDEHMQLVQAYRNTRDGHMQAVVIQGEPGIGKTRLAQEFLGWASAQGALVIQAAAYELTVNLPYQVWVDAFRQQLSQPRGRTALDALDPVWRVGLGRMLPELAASDTSSLPLVDRDRDSEGLQSQNQLFESVFRLVRQLVQGAGSATLPILFLDDAQWIDVASLDLLQYLTHRCVEMAMPMLLVMTLRQDAADGFEALLSALRRRIPIKVLPLGSLSLADSDHLVQSLVARALKQEARADDKQARQRARQTEQFAHALFDETAGHPLYLLETFKSLLESTPLHEDEGAAGTGLIHWQKTLAGWLAPGVKAVIQARLKRLSPRALMLINAVAVLGQRNDFEVCYQTANLNEQEALGLLDETTRRGLLRESASGVISFTHDKIREVVYADLSPSRRRSLHRRSAETLEQLHHDRLDDYAPMIASHFAALSDPRARAYFERAGHAAARVFAYHEAAIHFARAIEMALDEARNPKDIQRRAGLAELRASITSLHYKQASMYVQVAAYGTAIQTMRQLGALARQWNDVTLEHNTRVWIAPNLALPGPYMQLDEAEQLAGQIRPQARAMQSLHDEIQAMRTLMRVALWRAQFDLADQFGQEILQLVDDDLAWPDPVLHGYVLHDLTLIALFRHDLDAAHRYQTHALQIWQRSRRPALIVSSLDHACWRALSGGEFDVAMALSEEALGISQHMNNPWTLMLSQARTGEIYFECGQEDLAIANLLEAVHLSQRDQHNMIYLRTSVELARIYGKLGNAGAGLEIAQMTYQTAALKMKEWQLMIVPELVQLHVLQQDLAQADAWLERGRALMAARSPWPTVQILLNAAEAELALARDNAEHALCLSIECVSACRQYGWRQELPLMLLLECRALCALGRLDEAMQVIQAASEEATAIQARWSLQKILAERAAMEPALTQQMKTLGR